MIASQDTERLRRCVLAESIYNMLSLHGDASVELLVDRLRVSWSPMWAPAYEVITSDSVAATVAWLIELGLVQRRKDLVAISVRDPQTRRGRDISTDYRTAQLTWKGRRA